MAGGAAGEGQDHAHPHRGLAGRHDWAGADKSGRSRSRGWPATGGGGGATTGGGRRRRAACRRSNRLCRRPRAMAQRRDEQAFGRNEEAQIIDEFPRAGIGQISMATSKTRAAAGKPQHLGDLKAAAPVFMSPPRPSAMRATSRLRALDVLKGVRPDRRRGYPRHRQAAGHSWHLQAARRL